jgi:uncharacterized protein (TIGR02001 family)
MKTISKAIAIASLATVATAANAEVAVTGGVMSDYVFRGISQSTGSGYAAVDYEESGFYAGVWGADVGDALEVDLYLGYGIELDSGVSISAGFTRYEYTSNRENADLSQDEFNLNLGMAGFGIGYVLGSNNLDAGDQDYDVITLTYDAENWGFLVGMVDNDDQDNNPGSESEYNWAEVSTSAEVAGLTVGATVGVQFNAEAGGADTESNDGYITFDISKSFDL